MVLGDEKKISGIAGTLLKNPVVVFLLAMFIAVVLWQIDIMASFADAIYDALDTSFAFLPVIAIVGALAFMSSRRR